MKGLIRSLIIRLKWWISKENKYCKCCCLFCRYFDYCRVDVAREKEYKENPRN